MVRDRLRQAIIQVGHRSREVRLKTVWTFHVSWIVEIRLHEDPIELKLRQANFSPDQLGYERRNESGASALIGICECPSSSVARPILNATKIECMPICKSRFLNGGEQSTF